MRAAVDDAVLLDTRAFERSDLGGSLCAALDGAMSSVEAARKLVPTNEGGIGLHLQLYKSKICGEMYKIHTEKYERLDDNGKFEVISGSPATLATIPQKELDIENCLPLGVFEWSVELWKGIEYNLDNTFDGYKKMPLRNQLARGSAWGFFVTQIPHIKGDLSIKSLALNPLSKSTPELIVGGERIGGNVCDAPMPYVTAAADYLLTDKFEEALKAAKDNWKGKRVLIVNDITCGKLPWLAAQLGCRVDVVNESEDQTSAGREAAKVARRIEARNDKTTPGRARRATARATPPKASRAGTPKASKAATPKASKAATPKSKAQRQPSNASRRTRRIASRHAAAAARRLAPLLPRSLQRRRPPSPPLQPLHRRIPHPGNHHVKPTSLNSSMPRRRRGACSTGATHPNQQQEARPRQGGCRSPPAASPAFAAERRQRLLEEGGGGRGRGRRWPAEKPRGGRGGGGERGRFDGGGGGGGERTPNGKSPAKVGIAVVFLILAQASPDGKVPLWPPAHAHAVQ